MNSNTQGAWSRALTCVASGAAVALVPAVALADSESGADASILIPKPAEFIPALIAFGVILVVMWKFAWPSIIDMMDKRQKKIEDDLDHAEQARAKALAQEKEYEERMAEAHRDADAIIAEAKKEAEAERQRILAKAQQEAAALLAKSRGAVETERRKAMIELSSSVVDLAVEVAGKIIGEDLSYEQQLKLAEKHLAEVAAPEEIRAAEEVGARNAK